MFLLAALLAADRGPQRDAVGRGRFDAGDVAQRGHHVGEVADVSVHVRPVDAVAPRHDEGHPDAAFAQRRFAPSLAAAEGMRALEPFGRGAGVRRRPVVARDDDDRVVPDAQPLQFGHQPADLPVEIGDHRGVGGVRPARGEIPLAFDRRFVAELLDVVLHHLVGSLHRAVRDGRRPHQEEGPFAVFVHEAQHAVVHDVGAVRLLRIFVVAVRVERIGALVERRARGQQLVVQIDAAVVLPEERRIVAVRLSLADAAEIFVEAHLVGRTLGGGAADAPLADHRRAVAALPHHRAERRRARFERGLSFERRVAQHRFVVPHVAARGHLVVGADLGVARVHARQQAAAGGRRERSGRIHVGEADAACCQRVDVGRFDARLAVTAEIAVAGVVHQDEDHVGLAFGHLVA